MNFFKYSWTPLTYSDDSLPEKYHCDQRDGLLGEERLPEWQMHGQQKWRFHTVRACEAVLMLSCVLMFVLGLHWRLNADQYCLQLHSFYCKHFDRTLQTFKEVLNEC